ncbi:uncharacterized protein LOC123312955 isoform X2 [Coccinella septempunctata]|nr:uncharacterized protein LOC123312955 isoform X2 [Coccinella septempunctata]XP_044753515.1 uncharacterized protein LOC123312955 isoform X2 [Coccinella septempunctata]XP_044753516.1 uncharacterized protein LOC123312955 isoform X2 [Coccinella septempunctata]XP_044753517.1 uncharacterized protein LOC123312955 isoform X2 [Coccinella septempunctata]
MSTMDLYWSATDSISFQDMLDIDIKSEIETLVGGHSDFPSFNFSDLPPLEFEEVQDIKWFSSSSDLSNSSLNLDFSCDDRTTMVNPNAVMPLVSLSQNVRSPSPSLKESHLTFSPSILKISAIKQEATTVVKKDLIRSLNDVEEKPILKTITKVTPILAKPAIKPVTKTPTVLTFRNTVTKPINITQVNNITTVRTVVPAHTNKKNFNNNNRIIIDDDERAYPKPAYSYSCLIAMALKNSHSGSLPVSEIYNFMCKHFPYFKTAPSGWKNSVRHNLSLNKCFEKIEKPALNGAQRKGCLWAMNPAKISKMDEEVQKWSKKDPTAIKKAMVYPEHLEALERGEMKFSCSYDESDTYVDSCGSAESEQSDSEQEVEAEVDNNINAEYEYVDIQVKNEEDDEYDIQVAEDGFEDMEDHHEMLRVEVALAQKELLEYERTMNNKRRKTYIIQN